MPDITAARRTPALAEAIGASAINVLPPAARFSLRLNPRLARERGSVAGFRIDQPINRAALGVRLSVRLGPGEFLLKAPEAEGEAITAEIAAEFGEEFHALVDLGHRNVALGVSGPWAADMLNAGCPLDLGRDAFPIGAATRTLLGEAEVVLIRTNDMVFCLECWRSFAAYVRGFLFEAARDFETMPAGPAL